MRKLGLVALAALLLLIPAGTASAKTKAEAFAAKHHLKGSWKGKDADKDGLKNGKEFKLGTDPRKADSDKDGLKDGDEVVSTNNPRKADTDGDGVKDGAEHAGTVTAFDGETITIREFATGKKVTAALDTECTPALGQDGGDDDATADDSSIDDGGDEVEDEGFGAFLQEDGDDEDVDAGTSTCTEAVDRGDVLQSAEIEDGYLIDYVIA